MIYLSRDRLSSDLIAIPLRHFLFRDRLAVCEAAFKDASMEWGLRGLVELPVEVVPVPAAVLAAASDEALDATAKDFLAREVRARLDPRFDDLCTTSSRRAGSVLNEASQARQARPANQVANQSRRPPFRSCSRSLVDLVLLLGLLALPLQRRAALDADVVRHVLAEDFARVHVDDPEQGGDPRGLPFLDRNARVLLVEPVVFVEDGALQLLRIGEREVVPRPVRRPARHDLFFGSGGAAFLVCLCGAISNDFQSASRNRPTCQSAFFEQNSKILRIRRIELTLFSTFLMLFL